MGLTLMAGMVLARRGRYRAHARCQSAVVLLNLVAITLTKVPSLRRSFAPLFLLVSTIPTTRSQPRTPSLDVPEEIGGTGVARTAQKRAQAAVPSTSRE